MLTAGPTRSTRPNEERRLGLGDIMRMRRDSSEALGREMIGAVWRSVWAGRVVAVVVVFAAVASAATAAAAAAAAAAVAAAADSVTVICGVDAAVTALACLGASGRVGAVTSDCGRILGLGK